MSALNPGLYGATRQSWSKNNPRDVLKDAIRNAPRASEAEIRETVWQTIKNEKAYLPAIFDYWFTNNYRHFFVRELEEHSTVIEELKQQRKVERKSNQPTRVEIEDAKAVLRPLLMDLQLSTGKLLRDSTFGECKRESGWLRDVAKQGKPNAVVGKQLTEKDLCALRFRNYNPFDKKHE